MYSLEKVAEDLEKIYTKQERIRLLKREITRLEKECSHERVLLERHCPHKWVIDTSQCDPGHTWKICVHCQNER